VKFKGGTYNGEEKISIFSYRTVRNDDLLMTDDGRNLYHDYLYQGRKGRQCIGDAKHV
jgi:hypothetical protein